MTTITHNQVLPWNEHEYMKKVIDLERRLKDSGNNQGYRGLIINTYLTTYDSLPSAKPFMGTPKYNEMMEWKYQQSYQAAEKMYQELREDG